MFKWIHLHFIPSEANNHQPHFLRLKIALGLFAMMVMLETAYFVGTAFILPANANFAAIFASVLVNQTNVERNSDSIGTLTINPKLEVAARLKAEDMAAKGYFSHNSPDGKTPWYWFEKAGYDYAAAGENLAVNFTDSKDVTAAWMRSPSHRANILNDNYTEIGIATAEGIYKGKRAIFVVQEFGRESVVARQVSTASSTVSVLAGLITDAKIPVITKTSNIDSKVLAATSAQPKPVPVAESKDVVTALIPQVQVPTTTAVAGVETQKLDITESIFAETIAVSPSKPTVVEMIIATPRRVTNTIYVIMFAILALTICLTMFIKIHIQHPRIIMHGMALLVVITALIVMNDIYGFSRGVV